MCSLTSTYQIDLRFYFQIDGLNMKEHTVIVLKSMECYPGVRSGLWISKRSSVFSMVERSRTSAQDRNLQVDLVQHLAITSQMMYLYVTNLKVSYYNLIIVQEFLYMSYSDQSLIHCKDLRLPSNLYLIIFLDPTHAANLYLGESQAQ